jgi:hypothetical protein
MAQRKRKQTFPCGHRGQGRECQRCLQEARAAQAQAEAAANRLQEKEEWEACFGRDVVDLRGLPKHIVKKARQVIQSLDSGQDYRVFKGKQMRVSSQLVRIPLNDDYRLIVRHSGRDFSMLEVLSHEDYDKKYGKNQRKVG